MDVRIEGVHEQMLTKLAEANGEKTAAGMVRILIRDAARDLGVWPDAINGTADQIEQPKTEELA